MVNAIYGSQVIDENFKIVDEGDPTKKLEWEVSGIAAGTVVTITAPTNDFDFNAPVFGGKQIIDVTDPEALLVRKDGDSGDVFVVDTTNSVVAIGGVAPVTGCRLVLPVENEQATPTLAFGDGSMGWYANSAIAISFSTSGQKRWFFDSNSIGSYSNSGVGIRFTGVSNTNPSVRPRTSDGDTGIGSAAADQLSLIAGGVELIRLTEAGETNIVTTGVSHTLKRFLKTITLNTSGEETDVGLTPNAVIMSAAIRVSTEIQGLDSDNHTINLGLNGNIAKYISVAHGSTATTIAKNKKDNYTFDPTTDTESAALKLTIGVGTDKTPTAGAVEVEVLYLDSADLADT